MQSKQEVTRSTLPNGARGKSYTKYGCKGNHLLGYGKASWLFVATCSQGLDFIIFRTLTGSGLFCLQKPAALESL